MDLVSAAYERDQLRAEFPYWGIFHDPYGQRWYAVHGRRTELVASSSQELRQQLLQGSGQSASPARGQSMWGR